MKAFWETHSSEMRKARLLAASAILLSQDPRRLTELLTASERSVQAAFELEHQIKKQLNKESK